MVIVEIQEPSGSRRIVHLAGTRIRIGKAPDCDIPLEHESVSKYHAEILAAPSGFHLRDLSSTNGTYLNERWVTETSLHRGDVIGVGPFTLTVIDCRPEDSPARPQVPPEQRGRRWSKATAALLAGLLGVCVIQAVVLFSMIARKPQQGTAPAPQTQAESKEKGRSAAKSDKKKATTRPPSPLTQARTSRPPVLKPPTVGVTHEPLPSLVAAFARTVEPVLLRHCLPCHDGRLGLLFRLRAQAPSNIRALLNLRALRYGPSRNNIAAFFSEALRRHSALSLLKGPAPQCEPLPRFLAEESTKKLLVNVEELGRAQRPTFTLGPLPIAPQRELLLRRAFQDLCGRPPTDTELGQPAARDLSQLIKGLLSSDGFQRTWKTPQNAVAGIIGSKVQHLSPVEALAAFYKRAPAGMPPRSPGSLRRIAHSLLVDLWNGLPSAEDVAALSDAFKCRRAAGSLPLAAFFLGRVERPEDPKNWIARACVRFLGRLPSREEERQLLSLLEEPGGPRGIVLALASSQTYLALPETPPEGTTPAGGATWVFVLDLGVSPRGILQKLETTPGCRMLFQEGVTILRVKLSAGEGRPVVEKLLDLRRTAGLKGKIQLLVPAREPFRDLVPQECLYAPDCDCAPWCRLWGRFGLGLRLRPEELAVCRAVRVKLLEGLSPFEEAASCAATHSPLPAAPRALLLQYLAEYLTQGKRGSVVAVLPRASETPQRGVPPDLDRILLDLLSTKSAGSLLYMCLPFTGVGPTEGCALLWSSRLRKGTVVTAPLSGERVLSLLCSAVRGEKVPPGTLEAQLLAQ